MHGRRDHGECGTLATSCTHSRTPRTLYRLRRGAVRVMFISGGDNNSLIGNGGSVSPGTRGRARGGALRSGRSGNWAHRLARKTSHRYTERPVVARVCTGWNASLRMGYTQTRRVFICRMALSAILSARLLNQRTRRLTFVCVAARLRDDHGDKP